MSNPFEDNVTMFDSNDFAEFVYPQKGSTKFLLVETPHAQDKEGADYVNEVITTVTHHYNGVPNERVAFYAIVIDTDSDNGYPDDYKQTVSTVMAAKIVGAQLVRLLADTDVGVKLTTIEDGTVAVGTLLKLTRSGTGKNTSYLVNALPASPSSYPETVDVPEKSLSEVAASHGASVKAYIAKMNADTPDDDNSDTSAKSADKF